MNGLLLCKVLSHFLNVLYIIYYIKKSILKLSALSVQTKIVWFNLFKLLDFASKLTVA